MKANELMIGDWVYDIILKAHTKVEILSVSGIRGDFHESVYNEKTFEPIPLTPEILEKNGFVVESRNYHGEPLLYCELVDGLWIDISGENYFEGKLEYVHQLQHALRLCGIHKEIEL